MERDFLKIIMFTLLSRLILNSNEQKNKKKEKI